MCRPGLSHPDWMSSFLNWQVWLREPNRVLHSGDKFVKIDFLIFHLLVWVRERCTHPLPTTAEKTAGPRFIRAGELALTLTSCSEWESSFCFPFRKAPEWGLTLLYKHRWASPEGVRAGKLTHSVFISSGQPAFRREDPASCLGTTTTTLDLDQAIWVGGNWIWGPESSRIGPAACCSLHWAS